MLELIGMLLEEEDGQVGLVQLRLEVSLNFGHRRGKREGPRHLVVVLENPLERGMEVWGDVAPERIQ